jgi:hypothetical protein
MQPKKISIALTYGLIAGLAMVLLTTILYLAGVNAFLGKFAYFGNLLPLAMAIVASLAEKKARGGFLEFRDALKVAFLVFVIALALQTLFNWILLNFIDQPFRQAVEQETMLRTERWLQRIGMSQEKTDEAIAREQGVNHFTLPRLITGLAIWYIVLFLVSLLIAAIVKKKKPAFESEFK